MYPETLENDEILLKFEPKWVPNCSKMAPKWLPGGLWAALGRRSRFLSYFGVHFGTHFGSQN